MLESNPFKKPCAALAVLLAFSLILPASCMTGPGLPDVRDLPRYAGLPDPLTMRDGTPVRNSAQWYQARRPELKRLFQHYVYGYLPPAVPIHATIMKQDAGLFGGKATYREVELDLQLPGGGTHAIRLSLFLPNWRTGPVPVFLALNKCGNHTVLDYGGISIIERDWVHPGCKEYVDKRGSRAEAWAIENTLSRGYALATFAVADMDPDKDDRTDGIHAAYPDAPGDENTRWGTLAAWAWGLLRVVDYCQVVEEIDKNRICLTGWSRRGKTALFAAAMDERVALVIPHQSGTGGMALSRMNPEESVARITEVFPHWFNGNFARFGEYVERLPVDQHLLVALVAPRPLMDNAGLKDTWASPHLALEAMKAATPVYEFLGKKGILGEGFVQDRLGDGEIGELLQFQRDTEHELDIHYWNAMLDFADLQLGRPPPLLPEEKRAAASRARNRLDERWSKRRARAWYEKAGVIRGCNYLPRTATNTTEMWQASTFTPDVMDEELGWAEAAGYNSVRVFVQYLVWKDDPEGLKSRMEAFLRIAHSHGIRTMWVPFDDCAFGYPPRTDPYLGPQGEPEPGEYSPYWTPSPGHSLVGDRDAWGSLERYVKDLVGRFARDERVLAWDLYNEPGNSGVGDRSMPLVEAAFGWAREAAPSQPLTVGAYAHDFNGAASRRFMERSDVITFHGYDPVGGLAEKIRICEEYGRPVICTECLIRRGGNAFAEFLPLFAEKSVGWYNWGLVKGRTHTFYHWGSKKGDPVPEVWQHDIFHPDGTPYRPEEIPMIRNFRFMEMEAVVPASEDAPETWRYTTEIPAYGWHLEKYDDTAWLEGSGAFGTRETPWVNVRTEWNTQNIWLRRTFDLERTDFKNPHLRVRHDEHAEIYLNGAPAAKVSSYNTWYELIPLGAAARSVLKAGRNVLAIHCHQTTGGQCIDAGLVDVVSGGPPVEAPVPFPEKIDTGARWPAEKAQAWYRDLPPIRGCNYLPRTAVNTVEMWQKETFDPETIDEELGWAEAAGYNSVRVFLQYAVWEEDREGFMERLERFLGIADRHGISAMLIFFDDVCFSMKLDPVPGPQDEPVPGLINSGWVPSPGYAMVQDPSTWSKLKAFVQDIVAAHGRDVRVLVWDLYNEPGPYFDSTLSFPLAEATFGWVRELDPIQPLTIGAWGNPESMRFLELSDVLSIHNYGGGGLENFFVERKKKHGRPILCTEWLMRPGSGKFQDMLPLFAKHGIGWYNWGLVAGRTQTYYHWGSKKGDPMPEVWMCDVLWPDGRPFDQAEIELIRKFEYLPEK